MPERAIEILFVEEDPEAASRVEALLRGGDVGVVRVRSLDEAIARLGRGQGEAVLLFGGALAQAASQVVVPDPADLDRFAAVVVHDLGEPLRVVSEYTRLLRLRMQDALDPSAGQYARRVAEAASRMQKLLASLLEYARAGTRPVELHPIAGDELVRAAIANLKVAIEEAGAVVRCAPLPTLRVDGVQLVQVFQNLIGNAIKFRGEAPPEIDVLAQRTEREWVVEVRDNGVGIDPECAERIFDAFYRPRSAAQVPGSGLGLAICKRIVERHGARIWVESAPGRGAAFKLAFRA